MRCRTVAAVCLLWLAAAALMPLRCGAVPTLVGECGGCSFWTDAGTPRELSRTGSCADSCKGTLNLGGKSIATIASGTFNGLEQLHTLYLFLNDLTTIAAGTFVGMPALRVLAFSSNKIAAVDPAAFDGLDNLQLLTIPDNPLGCVPGLPGSVYLSCRASETERCRCPASCAVNTIYFPLEHICMPWPNIPGVGRECSDLFSFSHCTALFGSFRADAGTYRAGTSRTIAGSSEAGYIDGERASARFNRIKSVALTPDDLTAVVIDNVNVIRRINMTGGEVSTLAGSPNDACAVKDGVGSEAKFCRPAYVEIFPDDASTAWIWEGNGKNPRNISLADGKVPADVPTQLCDSISLQECKEYASQVVPWQKFLIKEIESFDRGIPTGCSLHGTGSATVVTFNKVATRNGTDAPGSSTTVGSWQARICIGGMASPWINKLSSSMTFAQSEWHYSQRFTGSETSLTWQRSPQYRSKSLGVGVGIVGNRIFKFNLTHPYGTFATLAGYWGGSNDNTDYANGVGSNVRFSRPQDLAVTADGNFVIVADEGNNCLRRLVIATGETSTLTHIPLYSTSKIRFDPPDSDEVLVSSRVSASYSASVEETYRVNVATGQKWMVGSHQGFTSSLLISVDGHQVLQVITHDHCRSHASLVKGIECTCDPGFNLSPTVLDQSIWNNFGARACVPCKAGLYKPVGFQHCVTCPIGTFSREGSKWCDLCTRPAEKDTLGSSACIWPIGFGRVVFTVLLPISLEDFGPTQQQSYIESIAETSQTPATNIALLNMTSIMAQTSLGGTRRTSDSMDDATYLLQIQTQVSTTRVQQALIKTRLTKQSIDTALTLRGLPATISQQIEFNAQDMTTDSSSHPPPDAPGQPPQGGGGESFIGVPSGGPKEPANMTESVTNCTLPTPRLSWLIFQHDNSTGVGLQVTTLCIPLPTVIGVAYGALVLACCCFPLCSCYLRKRSKRGTTYKRDTLESNNYKNNTSIEMASTAENLSNIATQENAAGVTDNLADSHTSIQESGTTEIAKMRGATQSVNAADILSEFPESVTSQRSTHTHNKPPQRLPPCRPIPTPKPAHLRVADDTTVNNDERSAPPLKPLPKPFVSQHTTPPTACAPPDTTTTASIASAMNDTVAAAHPQNAGVTSAVIWKEVVHEASGRVYYWNTETNTTSWSKPPPEQNALIFFPSSTAAGGGEDGGVEGGRGGGGGGGGVGGGGRGPTVLEVESDMAEGITISLSPGSASSTIRQTIREFEGLGGGGGRGRGGSGGDGGGGV